MIVIMNIDTKFCVRSDLLVFPPFFVKIFQFTLEFSKWEVLFSVVNKLLSKTLFFYFWDEFFFLNKYESNWQYCIRWSRMKLVITKEPDYQRGNFPRINFIRNFHLRNINARYSKIYFMNNVKSAIFLLVNVYPFGNFAFFMITSIKLNDLQDYKRLFLYFIGTLYLRKFFEEYLHVFVLFSICYQSIC